MSGSSVILAYEPPAARVAGLLVVAWLVVCVATVIWAVTYPGFPTLYRPPIYRWHWLALPVAAVVGGFWGLLRQRAWRALAICAGIVLLAGVPSGALQLSSCPHATYLQVAGFYVPVFGDPCNNEQNYYLQPWWML